MNSALAKLGGFVARHKFIFVVIWLVVLIGLVGWRAHSGGEFSNDYNVPGSQSQEGSDLLDSQFPKLSGNAGQIVYHSKNGNLESYASVINQTAANLAKLPHMVYVTSPFAAPNSPLISKQGDIAYANLSLDVIPTTLDESYLDQMDAAVQPARDAGLEVEYGGSAGQVNSATSDLVSEIVGLVAALILLIITFRSLFASLTPLIAGIFSVLAGLSILGLLAAIFELPTTAPTIATLLGLGVAIDYGLFLVARHREQLDEGIGMLESISKTEATSGTSIVVAGGTVVIAILGLFLAGVPFVGAMGAAAAIVVAVTIMAALTFTPALLALGKRHVQERKNRQSSKKITKASIAAMHAKHERSPFARWGRKVSTTPWPWAIGTAIFLMILAIPLFSMQLGQLDAGTDAPDTTSRKAYDLMTEGFGPGINGTLSVVMSLPKQSPQQNQALISSTTTKLLQTPGVASVMPPSVNQQGTVAVINAVPKTSPQDAATTTLTNNLRDSLIPTLPPNTYLTGTTAGNIDFTERVLSRLPILIIGVVALSFVLLAMSFRSLLIPTKAAIMNLLSVGAAYGIIVAVFQWQWGSGLLGVNESVPIPAYVPMLMFAIVFGLSMDYEVFLLSRIHEAYLKTKDSHRAVAIGIGSTAKTITTAAAIMVVVFTSFVLSEDVSIKMMAIGMAAAVLIDSTVVRMMLVPAIMSLLGKRAWWMPRWLDKILPSLSIE